MKSIFRICGLVMAVGGVAMATCYFLFFDTTTKAGGVMVHNIGLLAERQDAGVAGSNPVVPTNKNDDL